MKFYLEPTEKVFSAVESSEKGLTSAETEQRLAKYGKNRLKEAEKDSLFKKFINSLADPMIIMLLVAAAIQAVVTVVESGANLSFRDFADVLVILVVVIINTVMSLVQDSKAEAAMDALMEMTAATSHVLRDGEVSAKSVFDAVKAGDAVAQEIAEEFGRYLGLACANIAGVVDPQVFVIGGGVSKAGKILFDYIEKYYKKYAFPSCKDAKFALATLGNDAGIYGAAKLML